MKKILFDQLERMFIINYYKNSNNKSVLWKWWNSNLIINRYEILKSQKLFIKTLTNEMQKTIFFKILFKLNKSLT